MWASARLHGAVLLLSVVCSVFNGGFRTFLFSPALGLYGSIVQCSVSQALTRFSISKKSREEMVHFFYLELEN